MQYTIVPLPAEAAASLKAGENTITIHADNAKGVNKPAGQQGSQFIDAGLGEETIAW